VEMFKYTVKSQCTALLNQKSGFGGSSDSGFSSCTAPTYYCASKYFCDQHPEIQKFNSKLSISLIA